MLLYSPEISSRLIYVCDFVFTLRGLHHKLTNDKSEFDEFLGIKLNYSSQELTGQQLLPHSLLFEDQPNSNLEITKGDWEGEAIMHFNGVADPLAAIFFVLTRYEEYIDSRRDHHNRFEPRNSWQVKFGWLERPIADIWALAFLKKFAPEYISQADNSVFVVPTFDIDNTFAYKWKDGWRKGLAVAKDRLKLRSERLAERKLVLTEQKPDPYDSFQRISEIAEQFPNTRVFWHLGDFAKYDRNISAFDERHRALIKDLSEKIRIGIHPSYASNSSDLVLAEEINRLEIILEKKVNGSRQHFLKLNLPVTYQRLLGHRIKSDYTMGYAQLPGFRMGTARPVMFFDLSRNLTTELQLVPFVYMDGTFNEYMRISVQEAEEKVLELFREIKKYGGVFSFIWHNETITNYGIWNGWSELLEYSLKLGAHV